MDRSWKGNFKACGLLTRVALRARTVRSTSLMIWQSEKEILRLNYFMSLTRAWVIDGEYQKYRHRRWLNASDCGRLRPSGC
jgi:hypothetical protein